MRTAVGVREGEPGGERRRNQLRLGKMEASELKGP